jgi:protein arginine kinase activator
MEGCMPRPCDICGKNDGSIPVSRMDKEGRKTELVICAECAGKQGFADVQKVKQSVGEIIAELKTRVASEDSALVCPRCGMTYAEFKRLGRLGCGQCYATFHDQLVPLVRRIHGSAQHVGRAVHGGQKQAQVKVSVQKLREQLTSAIQAEDYERAAALRDQLRGADKSAADK